MSVNFSKKKLESLLSKTNFNSILPEDIQKSKFHIFELNNENEFSYEDYQNPALLEKKN